MSPLPSPSPTQAAPASLPAQVTLRWLVRLRWVAVAGQAITIFTARWLLGMELPVVAMLALVLATAASNAALHAVAHRVGRRADWLLAATLCFDVGVLTGLLALSGGPSNPFAVLYLVHVTLAAVVLGPRWSAALVALSVGAYGALFWVHEPSCLRAPMAHEGFPLHLQGMWAAFGITAALITIFVTRIASELRSREAEVARLRHRAALDDKLASLTTLAAGAAHELGTPLSTIALVAKELERSVLPPNGQPALAADAQLIRTEVERCRTILQQMSADAGQTMGELAEDVPLASLSGLLQRSLSTAEIDRVQLGLEPATAQARVPPRALVQALRCLVRNGLDASAGAVEVSLVRSDRGLRLSVRDAGAGMSPEVLARAGEPFFTTKPPGRGMGLGLFLARALAERLGGTLSLTSSEHGTTATLELPQEAA